MPRGFTEQATVQNPLVNYAAAIGWDEVSREDQLVMRHGEAGLFFYEVLRDQLVEMNPGAITTAHVDDVIKRLEGARNSIEGNEDVLLWVRGKRSVHSEKERREVNVTVIDFAHP